MTRERSPIMFDILFALPPERFAAVVAGGLVVNFAPGADAMFATACGIKGGPRVGEAVNKVAAVLFAGLAAKLVLE
ncbi:MAG: hypothetical protein Q8Q26_12600 [Pseudorhodobacter sp.]|nr:hypothetical protein [Pseudorhodobacter sp.]